MVYYRITNGITLKTAEHLATNPLTPAWVLVTGDALEGVALSEAIAGLTGHLASVQDHAWEAVGETIADEAIAPVRWICELCIDVGIEEPAVTTYEKSNLCQGCADDLRRDQ